MLAFYDVNKPTIVCTDASGQGLGAVLMQCHNEEWKPVAYASRTLTKTEKGYAPIEQECLACTWACEKFSRYLVGLERFELKTDHKPLIPLINTRDMDLAPLRCQRLLLRLMRFNVVATHVPGKEQTVADTLSRQPLVYETEPETEEEVKAYVHGVMSCVPIRDPLLLRIRQATAKDEILQKVMDFMFSGWPSSLENNLDLLQLFHLRQELTIIDGLLVRGTRIVIPSSLREEIISLLHVGHQGVTKCRERASQSVWWPRISSDISDCVKYCKHCQEQRSSQRKEPLKPTPLPEYPWQKVGCDLCEVKRNTYLVIVDYYSRFIEIAHMKSTTSHAIIYKMQDIFARWGIPEVVLSDNGPQFSSREFANFANSYKFRHDTSSPHFPASNGEAERAVQTAKKMIACEDPFAALLSYRTTPIPSIGFSPVQLLLGRQIRTTVPTLTSSFKAEWPEREKVLQNDAHAKQMNEYYYNRRHGARTLDPLEPGDMVRMKIPGDKQWSQPAVVTGSTDYPRSYVVDTEGGVYRRNRQQLEKVPVEPMGIHGESEETVVPETPTSAEANLFQEKATPMAKAKHDVQQKDNMTTRSGRMIVPPRRLDL